MSRGERYQGDQPLAEPAAGRSASPDGPGLTTNSVPFPVVYSALAPGALLSEAAKAYPIGTPMICQLLKRGLNDTYLLQSQDERYIARVYRAQWRTPSEIAYELELLLHLAAKGVSVSAPIVARNGSLSRPLAAPEGTRYLVLFTYAQGRPLSWEEDDHCYLAGRVLAMIHTASDGFVSQHARRSLDLDYLIDQPLAAIRPLLAHRPGDWAYLEGLAARLRQRAVKAAAAGLDWGVCHVDFGTKSIHITDDAALTVFGFDHCGLGWRAYDFVLAQWANTGKKGSTIWEAFVRGYTQTRDLHSEDIAAVPLLHAMHRLLMVGVFAQNVGAWGTVRCEQLLNNELAFFQEWEIEHQDKPGGVAALSSVAATDDEAKSRAPAAGGTQAPLFAKISAEMPAKPEQPRLFREVLQDQPKTALLQSGRLAITHSIVSAGALLREIDQAYARGMPTCQLLQTSLNDTYLLATRSHRYIARVYGARWRSSCDIAYELELLLHLAAKGVSVSAPIAARDGSLSHPLPTPEGTRYLVLFTYAQGRPLSWEEDDHCYLAGRVLALIHAASDDFVSQHARFHLDLDHLIDKPLAALCPFLAHRPADWAYLKGLAARLRELAATAGAAGLDWGPCHGDLQTKNIHIADDGTLTIFDFDHCGGGWRAFDFASVQRAAIDQKKSGIWDTFVRGYAEIRHLAAADLAAVPLMLAIRRFWAFGLFATNVAEWGISRLTDRSLDYWLRFFRNWEAEHIGTVETISSQRWLN